MAWDTPADDKTVESVTLALKGNGFEVDVAKDRNDALEKLLASIPEGSEVLTVASTTLDQIGGVEALNDSGRYVSVKKRFADISDEKERFKARKASAITQYAAGSVQAITEGGVLVDASATGSQLAPYAYTADHLVLVVGTQKIVKDLDSALRRIKEYVVPLEHERMMKSYGTGTSLNKVLIYNRERPGRVKIILVKEKLGF